MASETRTDKIMALLQQIVAHQIEEKRARESYQEKRQEKEQERQKREEERFEVLKETVGEKLVQFSCKIDEVKEDNDGGHHQEGNEEREEEGGEMSHEKEGAEETDHLREECERAVQGQKSHQEAESPKGEGATKGGGAAGEADMSLNQDACAATNVGGDDTTEGRTESRYHLWYHRCRGRLAEGR